MSSLKEIHIFILQVHWTSSMGSFMQEPHFLFLPKETKEEWRLKASIIYLWIDGDLQNFRSATTKKADTKAPQNSHQTSKDKHWIALCVCLSHGTLEGRWWRSLACEDDDDDHWWRNLFYCILILEKKIKKEMGFFLLWLHELRMELVDVWLTEREILVNTIHVKLLRYGNCFKDDVG